LAKCQDCEDTGWLMVVQQELRFGAVTEVRRAVKCRCLRAREALFSIPEKYRHAELTGFKPAVENAARSWLETPVDMFVTGNVGAGKTWLVCAMVKAGRMKGLDITFREMPRLYRELREAIKAEDSPDDIQQRCSKAPLLVLDDIGVNTSDFEKRVLFEIVSERLNYERPTVITTNLTLAEISVKIDDRLASRLSSYAMVELEGRDQRLPNEVTVG
jgi:DNA replication protein DnaC